MEEQAAVTNTLNGSLSEDSILDLHTPPSTDIANQNELNHDIEHRNHSDSFSSESDALVIDESVPKKKKKSKGQKKRKKPVENGTDETNTKKDLSILHNELNTINSDSTRSDNSDIGQCNINRTSTIKCDNPRLDSEQYNLPHTNPYFNESLFELSQLHQATAVPNDDTFHQTGSQPAASQFNCPKCSKSGFNSLPTLQDHYFRCNSIDNLHNEIKSTTQIPTPLPLLLPPAPQSPSSCGPLQKNIFLCAACGIYYESWNLYKHMVEYHKRYICLYCLGMFSISEDLCHHIQNRHNLEPGIKNTLEEFFNTYDEPCYVICCECNSQFSEEDNFFYHKCVPIRPMSRNKVKPLKLILNNTASNVTESNNVEPIAKPVKKNKNTGGKKKKTKLNNAKENGTKNEPPLIVPPPLIEPYNNDDENESKSNENLQTSDDLNHEFNIDEPVMNYSLQNNDIEELTEPPADEVASPPLVDTRKVPKLSLKLIKKPDTYRGIDSDGDDDNERHFSAMEIRNAESENEENNSDLDQSKEETQNDTSMEENEKKQIKEPADIVAGPEVPIIEIQLDQPLDKMDIKPLVQKCLRATVPTCIYCNHSRRINVNGKQLGLHAIAEHRYSAINQSITAEELIPESFNTKIRQCLDELESIYFNLESESSEAVTYSHVFECFQCHYSTTVHKELYLHNRKFHSKNVLLCIMCKSNFYSYSELLCHLCPGIYVLDFVMQFRCCMCVTDDLPSSFRLMVHMRKKHKACDVCLEMCNNQYKLSNHVWKHKLHHFCYRCGIAYRNKPDITRHLFWKHGTESVLCKKCCQKKWPHVYHFCMPPSNFPCDECNLIFSKAVSLKVHKRLHTNEKKHPCTWGESCNEAFISKKLMLKHLKLHTDPPLPPPPPPEPEDIEQTNVPNESGTKDEQDDQSKIKNENDVSNLISVKPKMDVCDLPELNLSESDSSDSENEEKDDKSKEENEKYQIKVESEVPKDIFEDQKPSFPIDIEQTDVKAMIQLEQQQTQMDDNSVMQNIWDNFKNYQANKEKLDHIFSNDIETKVDKPYVPDIPIPIITEKKTDELLLEDALRDHDYCGDKTHPPDTIVEIEPALESTERVDHDYCVQSHPADKIKQDASNVESETNKEETAVPAEPPSQAEKKSGSSSSSSSDSDSSCACGSSCSCSDSSSDSSSSSSDSSNSDSSTVEGRKKQLERRLKRKTKNRSTRTLSTNTVIDVVNVGPVDQQILPIAPAATVSAEMPIYESDLETTESETDEEFYDREPLKFAKKLLEERRAQLLADAGTNNVTMANGGFIESSSRPPTPPEGAVVDEDVRKKKKKTKKRKKKKSEKKHGEERTYSATLIIPEPTRHDESAMSSSLTTEPSPSYYHQNPPTVAPLTLSLSRINSPALPQVGATCATNLDTPTLNRLNSNSSDQSSLRASKRKRVPNKFYGYSSEEEGERQPGAKKSKTESNKALSTSSQSPKLIPPITLRISRPPPTPTYNYHTPEKRFIPPLRLSRPPPQPPAKLCQNDSGSDSDSDVDTGLGFSPAKLEPLLYCYCRCPYDEVSEMIGCDSSDCKIEWFHFECVGIMVPPKGQWFCPDCRKKKQQQQMQQQQQYREIFT